MIYTPFQAFKSYVENQDSKAIFSSKESAEILVVGQYRLDDFSPTHKAVFVPFTGTNRIDIKLLKEKIFTKKLN